MIQESFADCSAVGTSHSDNPIDLVSVAGECIDEPSRAYPWWMLTARKGNRRLIGRDLIVYPPKPRLSAVVLEAVFRTNFERFFGSSGCYYLFLGGVDCL